MSEPDLLAVEALHVRYPVPGRKTVAAVKGVSLGVAAGESLGIVGESGCGKSSLARAVVGLTPVHAGRILYEGRDVAAFTTAERAVWRRGVQMIFQDAVGSLNPRMTLGRTLEEVLHVHHADRTGGRAAQSERIAFLLDAVGLPADVVDAYPRELSGGQCQRASIARCLALEPRVIIADEPVSALDVSVQARVLNLLRDLQRRFNLALILISHDLAVVRTVCDRAMVMNAGEVVEQGRPADIFAAPQHPYTRQLIAAVPDVRRALARPEEA